MNTLVAVVFEHDKSAAEKALQKLRALEKEYLMDLEDAVIVTRREDGKIQLKQSINLTGIGAWEGAFWGSLVGLIFTGPLGMVLFGGIGAGFGALTGSMHDYGLDDEFVKRLSEEVKPCCSALFVLIRKMTPDKVLEELSGIGGTIIKTSLSNDAEQKLQAALKE